MTEELYKLFGEPRRPIPRGYNPAPGLLAELKRLDRLGLNALDNMSSVSNTETRKPPEIQASACDPLRATTGGS